MQHVDALMSRCDAHNASKLHAHCCNKRRFIFSKTCNKIIVYL